MAHRSLFQLDTLDDRKGLFHMLSLLPPGGRVKLLMWACGRAAPPNMIPVVDPKLCERARDVGTCEKLNECLTSEVYGDLLNLAVNFGVDLVPVQRELERRVRVRKSKR